MSDARQSRIGCVLIPTIRKEWADLVDWLRCLPKPRLLHSEEVVLVLSLDDAWSDDDKWLLHAVITQSAAPFAWSRLEFCDCQIPAEESVYWRSIPPHWAEQPLRYGTKSGPNMQFFRSMQWIKDRGISLGSVLLLETDTVALAPGWLDAIEDELRSAGDFLLAGSRYVGQTELHHSYVDHINGNAVLNVAHPQWQQFITLWEEILLEAVPQFPDAAYDIVLEWCLARARDGVDDRLQTCAVKLAEHYLPRRLHLSSIVNLGGPFEASDDFSFDPLDTLKRWPRAGVIHCRTALPFRHELFLLKEQANGRVVLSNPVFGYDDQWQTPAITEKHAFDCVRRAWSGSDGAIYFGFPWARLIDLAVHQPSEVRPLLALLRAFQVKLRQSARVFTVCQHIYLNRFSHWLIEAGVTDVFWTHAVVGETSFPDGLQIHPFPLFPVQATGSAVEAVSGKQARRFLFSFVGARAYADIYLTPVRNWIVELLANHPQGYVRVRDVWHYQHDVYDKQILKNSAIHDNQAQREAEIEFQTVLAESVFALCPSGSGPNSIRLWESIALGTIPVILSDTWLPPGVRKLWDDAAIFVPETREAVMALPEALAHLAADEEKMASKRKALGELYRRYGPECFIYDLNQQISHTVLPPARRSTDFQLRDICDAALNQLDDQVWRVCAFALQDRARRSPVALRKAWLDFPVVRQATSKVLASLPTRERKHIVQAVYFDFRESGAG